MRRYVVLSVVLAACQSASFTRADAACARALVGPAASIERERWTREQQQAVRACAAQAGAMLDLCVEKQPGGGKDVTDACAARAFAWCLGSARPR